VHNVKEKTWFRVQVCQAGPPLRGVGIAPRCGHRSGAWASLRGAGIAPGRGHRSEAWASLRGVGIAPGRGHCSTGRARGADAAGDGEAGSQPGRGSAGIAAAAQGLPGALRTHKGAPAGVCAHAGRAARPHGRPPHRCTQLIVIPTSTSLVITEKDSAPLNDELCV